MDDDEEHKIIQRSIERLRRDAEEMTMDQVVARKLVVKTLHDWLVRTENSKRVCPGCYWRADANVPKAIEDWNDSSSRKRARADSNTECRAKRRRRKPSWERVYTGPARKEDGVCCSLCSACGQCYKRDVKNEFFKP